MKGGRRPQHRYGEIFALLGEPPDDPLELVLWAQRGAARIAFETMMGRGNCKLNAQYKALSNVIVRLMPFERLAAAERTIKGARAPAKPMTQKGPEVQLLDVEEPAEPSISGPIRR